MEFVFNAIAEHKGSEEFSIARDAELYAEGKNVTIEKYQKLLYKMTGEAVPDVYTANWKLKSKFFKRFITQEVAYELGNGVTFKKEETKEKLDKKIDNKIYQGAKEALIGGVSFCFRNFDHIEFYKITEFVPIWDEYTGELKAGIRFWQIDANKPLMATLFELDGYTDYVNDKDGERIKNEKRSYKQIIKSSPADGETIEDGGNYKGFPIIPLYGNAERQSEMVGNREKIDCYDLIESGFANDVDDASMIYWTLTNSGGMDDVDLAKFIERMKILRAATIDGDDGARAEAHTINVPYQAREVYLTRIERGLYKDFMALDVEQIAAGAVTATQIQAAYEPLNEKADELEMCLFDFFEKLLEIAEIDDVPSFTRSMISNQGEMTQMVLSSAQHLDEETILKKLPFIGDDEISEILKRKQAEEVERVQALMSQAQGV